MEWWHLGPVVLAVLMFLVAGTTIQQHLETAVLSIVNRQPPASRATVGVETSDQPQQQQQPQQPRQQHSQQQQQSQHQQESQQKQQPQEPLPQQQEKQQNDIPPPLPIVSEKSLLRPTSKTSTIASRPMEVQLNTKPNKPL